jgi:hypothetical protein
MRNILAALLLLSAAPALGEAVMQNASGTFEVTITIAANDTADGVTLGRMTVAKRFAGPLTAVAQGEMLTGAGGVANSAAYVLIERVTGMLDGRAGSFALAHLGVMDRGKPELRVTIVPDSGSGGLAGISGTLVIRIEGGKHYYDLDYRLTPP